MTLIISRSLSGVIAENAEIILESSSRHGPDGVMAEVRTGQEGRNSTGISPCRNI